jgi:hypothetical protein
MNGRRMYTAYAYYPNRDWIICLNGFLDEIIQEEIERSIDLLQKELNNAYLTSKETIEQKDCYTINKNLLYRRKWANPYRPSKWQNLNHPYPKIHDKPG